MERLLLVSLAVPTPDCPTLGPWTIWQAQALMRAGVDVLVVRPMLWCPRWIGRLSGRAARLSAKADLEEYEGVTITSPRTLFHLSPWVRYSLGNKAPELVSRWCRCACYRSVMAVASERSPNAVLIHGLYPWASLGETLSRRLQVPVSYIEHSGSDVAQLSHRPRMASYFRRHGPRARSVVVVGPQMQEVLEDVCGLPNACTVTNGVDNPPPRLLTTPRPNELRDRFVILHAANYYRRKGFEELVEAFERVADRHPNAVLCLITRPPDALRTRVMSSPVASRIRLIGPQPNELVRQWMAWADLFAMPSWGEGFALAASESMVGGTPIVVCEDGGHASMLRRFDPHHPEPTAHGWVIPPRDIDALAHALDEAMRYRHLLPAMGAACRQMASERLTWEASVRRLVRVIGQRPITASREEK
jgi:glycosyltransferase involved in cell wall biosynthesis